MSSVAGAYSQVQPYKRWIAGASANIYTITGLTARSVSAGVVLQDMGKTVYITNPSAANVGSVLRKVRVLPFVSGLAPATGYIYISDQVPNGTLFSSLAAQNVTRLN